MFLLNFLENQFHLSRFLLSSMACKFNTFLSFIIKKFSVNFFFISLFFIQFGFSEDIPSNIGHLGSRSLNCTNRWIYIRQLPSRFNLDLLANCSEYPIFGDFCPYLANHGLGQKTHNHSQSWYRTHPLMLELIFHRRMLEYPCLTSDPQVAHAFYLPYYAAIDSVRYLYGPEVNSSADHGLELYHFLKEDMPNVWNRHLGHDHFLVLALPAWDFSQPLGNNPPLWGTSFLELPELLNITALTVESRAWSWQEQAVPYPTSFHPPSLSLLGSWVRRVRLSKRNTWALVVGCGGVAATPNIRKSIRDECENKTVNSTTNNVGFDLYGGGYSSLCESVDCSNGICEHDPIIFMKPMLRASFCLQPPGDTPTRRSTFDSILAGCIPVFFEEQTARAQYGWHLLENQFEEFSVFIPKEDVVFKGLRIFDVLRSIPRARVMKMREKVIELIPRIIYRRHGGTMGLGPKMDAFDIAIEGTLRKVKSRINDVFYQ